MAGLYSLLIQSWFIPKPTLTETNLTSQQGKVFIITGGYSGIGLELANILYQANGTVYIAGRSREKAAEVIAAIEAKHQPHSTTTTGRIAFLKLDLADLPAVKASVAEFLTRENRLDVLWNNAAAFYERSGTTRQGHERVFATNILGPHLFTKLLLPLLRKTAENATKNSVRVVWVASIGLEFGSPKGGLTFASTSDRGEQLTAKDRFTNYTSTKTASYFLATEFARNTSDHGFLSLALIPGNLKTPLHRHVKVEWPLVTKFLTFIMFHPPIFGAYTLLYAGLASDIDIDNTNGTIVWAWGRKGHVFRKDIRDEVKVGNDGSRSFNAEKLWNWCEMETLQWQ